MMSMSKTCRSRSTKQTPTTTAWRLLEEESLSAAGSHHEVSLPSLNNPTAGQATRSTT